MESKLYHLGLVTSSALDRALAMAKEGRKDEARNWARYFFQSSVIDILELNGKNVQPLREQLKNLFDECHPLNAPDFKPDIQRIADSLQILADHIMRKPAARDGRKVAGN